MRSKKLSAALASSCVLALLVAAFAAVATSAPAPVGSGKGSEDEERLRPRQRQEGDRQADRHRRHLHQERRESTSRHRDHGEGLLRVRERNGGINGRRIGTTSRHGGGRAGQARRATRSSSPTATRPSAIVGNTSDLDCIVNQKFYERRGFTDHRCGRRRAVLHDAELLHGQHGTALQQHRCGSGARQGRVRSRSSTTRRTSRAPTRTTAAVPSRSASAQGFPRRTTTSTCRSRTRTRSSSRWCSKPASGGGIDIALIPPEGLKVLTAAAAQGVVDRVKWSGATPFNSQFIADALGPEWNNKFLVNAEFNLLDSKGPDNQLYLSSSRRYQPRCPACFGSFGQMGFLVGKLVTYTLLALPVERITQKSVNAAFLRIKNFKSDLWCRPWYFGNLKSHNAEQLGPHRHVREQEDRPRGGLFRRSPPSTRGSSRQGGREEVQAHVRDVLATGSGAVG